MEVWRHVSMALHILADLHNVVGWWLALNYMRTHATNYYLETSEQSAYVEPHPHCAPVLPLIMDQEIHSPFLVAPSAHSSYAETSYSTIWCALILTLVRDNRSN